MGVLVRQRRGKVCAGRVTEPLSFGFPPSFPPGSLKAVSGSSSGVGRSLVASLEPEKCGLGLLGLEAEESKIYGNVQGKGRIEGKDQPERRKKRKERENNKRKEKERENKGKEK